MCSASPIFGGPQMQMQWSACKLLFYCSVTDLSVKNNLFLKKTLLTQQQLLIKTTTIYTHMEDKQ